MDIVLNGRHLGLENLYRMVQYEPDRGVEIVEITLHVGYGTFRPVRVTDIRDHRMHSERFTISPESNRQKACNGAPDRSAA